MERLLLTDNLLYSIVGYIQYYNALYGEGSGSLHFDGLNCSLSVK